MKKQILVGLFACFAFGSISQNSNLPKSAIAAASNQQISSLTRLPNDVGNAPKTLLCNDTIRYPQIKEQLLNVTASFFTFTLWTDDAEYMSQTYQHTGGSITIPKIEFFGNKNTAGAASIIVEGAIYNVDALNNPTTLISSGTLVLSSTTAGYRYITLSAPAVVTGNYAVVIRPTTANGRLDLYVNNSLAGQLQDENLSRIRSSYYPQSNGNWVSVPVLTNDAVNFVSIYDFEALISPIVSYTITTNADAVSSPACLGTAVQFNNTTTPTGILNSRMYNYQRFNLYFGVAAADSTYAWDLDDLSPVVWSNSTNYTYAAAGTYDVTLYTLGGFWESCTDNDVVQVTINPAGNSNFNYSSASYCAGSANQTPTTFQAGIFSASPAGLNFVNAATGEINMATSIPGTYTISYTTTGLCPSTATQTLTINSLPNSSFSYGGSTFCSGGANITPTAANAGSFSSSPAGLVFANASTGEINMAASSENTYTVTHLIAGVCPSSTQQSITITSAPLAGFNYSQSAYCTNETSQLPSFVVGASGGVFSSTAGLTITANGEITPSSSTPGTYTITNTIAASGSCPSVSETTNITINATPNVTLAPLTSVCIADPSFQLIGGIPAMGVYSGTGVNAGMFSPSIAQVGIHPITYTYSNGICEASATQSITVGSIPTVSMAPFSGEFCENDQPISLPVATPSGGVYSGNGVSGSNFDPSISGNGTFQVTYTFTSAEGCEAFAFQPVVVNETPVVTLSALSGTCVDYAAFALTGGSPSGGNYAGPGVGVGGIFDPAIAGVGTHTITYNFISAEGCDGTAQQTISVDACASLDEITEFSISIYPNPANDIIHVSYQIAGSDLSTISLLNLDGKVVARNDVQGQIVNANLNVSSFAAGIYFVQIEFGAKKVIRKVVFE